MVAPHPIRYTVRMPSPQRTTDSETTPPVTDEESGAEHIRHTGPHLPALNLSRAVLYAIGGIAGGLLFTMMNNALPLFLRAYTMPLGLPAFLNPGGPIPASIVALLTNERSFFGGLIQPVVGHLSDRTRSPIGKRGPYLLVGGLGAGLAVSSLALHPSFWLMIAAVTLTGVLLFVAVGPYTSLLADITPHHQRGRIGGLIAFAGVVGALIFTAISVPLWDTARGWVFALTGLGVGGSLVVVALGVHEPEHVPHDTGHQARLDRRRLWHVVLHDRPLALYTLCMGVYWLGAGAASPFITRFGVIELHISESSSFFLLLPLVLSAAAGAILAGWLADRFGRKPVLLYSLIIFSFAAFSASLVQNLGQAVPVMVVVGLGNGALTALQVAMLADLVPGHRAGAFMGFANMVWSVAQPLGSFMAGLLVDVSGSYRGVFVLAAVCMAAAALILRFVKAQHYTPALVRLEG